MDVTRRNFASLLHPLFRATWLARRGGWFRRTGPARLGSASAPLTTGTPTYGSYTVLSRYLPESAYIRLLTSLRLERIPLFARLLLLRRRTERAVPRFPEHDYR